MCDYNEEHNCNCSNKQKKSLKSVICDVCKNQNVYEQNISSIEMNKCEYGHVFCDSHLGFNFEPDFEKMLENIKDFIHRNYETNKEIQNFYEDKTLTCLEDIEENHPFIYNAINDAECRDCRVCPICNLDAIKEEDAIAYLLKKNNMTLMDLKYEIKNQFNSYDEFKEFIQ